MATRPPERPRAPLAVEALYIRTAATRKRSGILCKVSLTPLTLAVNGA